jgi:hypothetical protein
MPGGKFSPGERKIFPRGKKNFPPLCPGEKFPRGKKKVSPGMGGKISLSCPGSIILKMLSRIYLNLYIGILNCYVMHDYEISSLCSVLGLRNN